MFIHLLLTTCYLLAGGREMFDALSPYTSPISPVYLPVAGGGDVRRARWAGGGHARRGPRRPGAGRGGLATLRGGERGSVAVSISVNRMHAMRPRGSVAPTPVALCRSERADTRRAPRPSSAGKRWRTRSYDGAGGAAARRVRLRRPVVAPARARARSRHRCDAVREAARYGGWEAHRTPEPEPEQTSSPGQARSTRGARCRASSRSRRAGGCHTPAKGS